VQVEGIYRASEVVHDQLSLVQGGQNGGNRRPSIGAKAIKSCGPHPQETAVFFPGSRLYAVTKSDTSILIGLVIVLLIEICKRS